MTKSKTSFPNQKGQSQEFIIEDYDDHIVLCAYCTNNVEDLEIPGTVNGKPVTQIGDGCFMLHKEIVNVSFPNTLESIGVQAFSLCSKIQELLLSDNIHEISEMAFRDCKGLKRIVLPASLRILKTGVFCFTYLPDDVEIILNDGLEEIQAGVFSSGGLNQYFTLKIPDSVKTIAPGAFDPGMKIITSLPIDDAWFSK